MTLPFDISRCDGQEAAPICRQCRRREPGDTNFQWYVVPAVENGECENFIDSKSDIGE